jgi:Kef-type K+ transport system membrane component KefB
MLTQLVHALASKPVIPAKPPGLTPDLVIPFVILDVVIILIVARLVGGLAVRIGQPRVVGEILAGVLLGPTLLGTTVWTWDHPWKFLHCTDSITAAGVPPGAKPSITACFFPQQAKGGIGLLGQVALILFMFLVGLELDYGLLRGKVRGIVTVAVGVVAIPLALGFLIAPTLYDDASKWVGKLASGATPSKTAFALMVGAMLAVTAFPVMARILQEKGLTQTLMGSVGVAAAAVVTVLMFLVVAVAKGVATSQSASEQFLTFFWTAVFLVVAFMVVRPLLERFVGQPYLAKGELTQPVFAVALIVMFASAYLADRIGINVIVGGFVAGAIMPARGALFKDMAARLSELTAVILLPIFLAFSGLSTDFTTLGASFIGGVVLFIVAGIVGKWLGGAVSARLGGLSWREGNVLGILMNCRGLLVLVVALVALNAGVISPQLQAAAVLMALITTAMTGPLFDRFQPAEAAAKRARAEPVPDAGKITVTVKPPPAG